MDSTNCLQFRKYGCGFRTFACFVFRNSKCIPFTYVYICSIAFKIISCISSVVHQKVQSQKLHWSTTSCKTKCLVSVPVNQLRSQILTTSISNPVNPISISDPSCQTYPTWISTPDFDLKSCQLNFDFNSYQSYQKLVSINCETYSSCQTISTPVISIAANWTNWVKLIYQFISINSKKMHIFQISLFSIFFLILRNQNILW